MFGADGEVFVRMPVGIPHKHCYVWPPHSPIHLSQHHQCVHDQKNSSMTSSLSKSLFRLLGAENHKSPHCTIHGTSPSKLSTPRILSCKARENSETLSWLSCSLAPCWKGATGAFACTLFEEAFREQTFGWARTLQGAPKLGSPQEHRRTTRGEVPLFSVETEFCGVVKGWAEE